MSTCPICGRPWSGLAEARSQISIPVVTGEELYTKREFREVFERRAADILNPDVCCCGGILELREIAAMAEPYHVAVAPHNYNSTTVGLAATLLEFRTQAFDVFPAALDGELEPLGVVAVARHRLETPGRLLVEVCKQLAGRLIEAARSGYGIGTLLDLLDRENRR